MTRFWYYTIKKNYELIVLTVLLVFIGFILGFVLGR